ncbi:MAG: hypothetical protein HRU15_02015 [Planctomycetes bacterium]|nr:hypothetical protein [Planctomycetota bacterium]
MSQYFFKNLALYCNDENMLVTRSAIVIMIVSCLLLGAFACDGGASGDQLFDLAKRAITVPPLSVAAVVALFIVITGSLMAGLFDERDTLREDTFFKLLSGLACVCCGYFHLFLSAFFGYLLALAIAKVAVEGSYFHSVSLVLIMIPLLTTVVCILNVITNFRKGVPYALRVRMFKKKEPCEDEDVFDEHYIFEASYEEENVSEDEKPCLRY